MENEKNDKEEFVMDEKKDSTPGTPCTPGQNDNSPKKDEKENNKNINIEIEENTKNPKNEKLILYKNLKAYIKCIKNNICCEENNNISEAKGKEGESKSIIDEFLEDKNILKNKEKLIAFMEELKFILKTGNNCIIPFLDLCPILIKSYIESDLDEEGGDSKLKYVEIFELLKYNSFISREYLCPIYDYFGRLHYLINTLKEDDKRLKKFKKVLELWNIIYTFESNNYPEMEIYNKIDKKMDKISCQTNTSSFCLLGTGLEFTFNEEIIPHYYVEIKILFITDLINELNKDIVILNIDNKNNPIKITFDQIKDENNQEGQIIDVKKHIINTIDIDISDEIKLIVMFKDITKNVNVIIPIKKEDFNFHKLTILENFFGQIEKIDFLKKVSISCSVACLPNVNSIGN